MLALLLAAGSLAASAPGRPPSVLVIYSNDRLLPANVALDGSLRKALEDSVPDVEVFSEFLGAPRFAGAENEASFAEYLKARYVANDPDVVVTVGIPALDFLRQFPRLFEDAALVAMGCSTEELRALHSEREFAGVPFDLRIDETLAAIIRIHPDRNHVLVISGSSVQDRGFEQLARRQLGDTAGSRRIEYLHGLSVVALERRLAASDSSQSVAIFLSNFLDDEGVVHHPLDVVTRLSATSKVPIYGIFDTYLGSGIVGGAVIPFGTHAAETARIVRRLLGGESLSAVGVTAPTAAVLVLDDRQIRRWGLKRVRIPRDAEFQFTPPSPWDAYRREIIIGGTLIAVQALLIVVLFFEQRRRRRAERRASSEARRLKLITNSLPALIAQVDADGRYVFANEAHRSWWHVDPSSLPGRTLEQVVGSDVYASIRGYVVRALGGERVQYGTQARLPDGSTRDLEALYVPDIDSEGASQGFYSLVMDVTDEKRAERENLILQSELAHASRMSTMGELSAALAHELNQPLAAIMSNAQAAQRFFDREEPDLGEVRSILADIVEDDRRASEVIRRLREFLAKGTVDMRPLNLNEVAREVAGMLGERLRSEQVALNLDLDASIPPIRGDRIQLQQVVLNLLTNSVDALSAGASDRQLIVKTSKDAAGQVELSVADSGPGFEPSMLEKAFEPFSTTKESGMGLGLSICHTLVEAHGGHIEARNRDVAGALVRFRLPAIEPQ